DGIRDDLVTGVQTCAFRSGAIPAPAESLDEAHGAHHAAAKNIHCRYFVGKSGALSGRHFEIASDAASVARDGEFQVFLGGIDSFLLNLSFVLEDPQCRYVVLNLLKTG